MKRILTGLLSVVLLLSLAACEKADTRTENESSQSDISLSATTEPQASEIEEEPEGSTNILIAYFSWSGNTRQVAEEIQKQTGGDLFELTLTDPYPEDYTETGERWRQEESSDARPALAEEVEHMEDYNVVFLGYPIWSGTLPSPNRTFLEQYDFSGKTIIPFCTHGGSRFGSSLGVIEELAPEAVLMEGFEISGNLAADCAERIEQWLNKLEIIE